MKIGIQPGSGLKRRPDHPTKSAVQRSVTSRSRLQNRRLEFREQVKPQKSDIVQALDRFRNSKLGQAFVRQEFGVEFEEILATTRANGPQKYFNSSRDDGYRARRLPYEMLLFIDSRLTAKKRKATLEALAQNQAHSPNKNGKPTRLRKNTDPAAIILLASIDYGLGAHARTTVSRDAAALRYLQSKGVKPSEIVGLAKKPGEGFEAWADRYRQSKSPHKKDSPAAGAAPLEAGVVPKHDAREIGQKNEIDDDAIPPPADPSFKPKWAKGIIIPSGMKIPTGTALLVVTREPNQVNVRVRAVGRVLAERVDSARSKRLMKHLHECLTGYDFK